MINSIKSGQPTASHHIMVQTLCGLVLALVALSFVEGMGNAETRPAQQSGVGGAEGAGGLMIPMSGSVVQPTAASRPAQLPQTQPYDVFDWLFNDYNYNDNIDTNAAASNGMVNNNNNNNNNNNAVNNMLMAMMMGFDFGF
ncbi:frizzled and smoothened-like protein O [Ylistrum balloti]|uniref:frizzled and smoothened-like protein O n=1 Tax=Ylistrum balloti TaxID=509963 RepID=UPI0029058724|nr:frizzled and smoothened-like protein O [Ylistrum balloti]